MASQLSLLSLKLNSLLKPLLSTLLWRILGIFFLLLHPLTTSSLKLKFFIIKFFFGLDSWKAYGLDGVRPVVLKNCASELAHCLFKLFRLCLSSSTYPSCWKFAHIPLVPKKGDRSNSSIYHPKALISRLSKAYESVLNKKIMRLTTFSLITSEARYTSDLLAFLTEF